MNGSMDRRSVSVATNPGVSERRRGLARLAGLAVMTVAAALAGCSGITTVSVEVQSQGAWPEGRAPGTYAIERLPSQQAQAAEQDRIEAAALPALEAAGFRPAPREEADVLVQLGAQVFQVVRRDPFWPSMAWRNDWWFYRGPWPHFRGAGFGLSYQLDTPELQREVAVLIRDRRSQTFVYETRGVYTSRWTSDALLPTLFQAAMKDFPAAAGGPRTVTVAVPRP